MGVVEPAELIAQLLYVRPAPVAPPEPPVSRNEAAPRLVSKVFPKPLVLAMTIDPLITPPIPLDTKSTLPWPITIMIPFQLILESNVSVPVTSNKPFPVCGHEVILRFPFTTMVRGWVADVIAIGVRKLLAVVLPL